MTVRSEWARFVPGVVLGDPHAAQNHEQLVLLGLGRSKRARMPPEQVPFSAPAAVPHAFSTLRQEKLHQQLRDVVELVPEGPHDA